MDVKVEVEPRDNTQDMTTSMDFSKNDWDIIFDMNTLSPKVFDASSNNCDETKLSNNSDPIANVDVPVYFNENMSPNSLLTGSSESTNNNNLSNNNNNAIVASFPVTDSQPENSVFNNKATESANEAIELALANEIEIHSPWIDVSALAASITNPSVNVCDQEPLNIFSGATFVPTHIQSYIDLNANSSENIIDSSDAYSYLPETSISEDSGAFCSENGNNIDANSLIFDASDDPEINDVFNSKSTEHSEINKLFEKDGKISESVNVFGMENLEINAANSVLFNDDLNLEDSLLFNNEPPSDMYIVQTESIFKDIARRNILHDLAADADICKCVNCKCDPMGMQCQSGCGSSVQPEARKNPATRNEKCNCVDCKCDPLTMQCQAGCGGPVDDNSNYLKYHKRHGPSNLEEFGLFTESSPSSVDSLKKSSCCSSDQNVDPNKHVKVVKSCCSDQSKPNPIKSSKSLDSTVEKSNPCCCKNSNNENSPNTVVENSPTSIALPDTSSATEPLLELINKLTNNNKSSCSCSSTSEGLKNGCCIVVCLKTIESLRQLLTYGYNLNNLMNKQTQKCANDTVNFVSKHVGCNNITTT